MAKIIGTTKYEIYKVSLLERKAYNNKWNAFVQCSSKRRLGLSCKYISSGTFADFRLKIFTQEKISLYGDPCP